MTLDELDLDPRKVNQPERWALGAAQQRRRQALYCVLRVELEELAPIPESKPPDEVLAAWRDAEAQRQQESAGACHDDSAYS